VHTVARVSSNVNKPPYETMFLVLVFIVHLHYMFRPLIGGHFQVICDKIYSKVATVYVNGSIELTCLRQVPSLYNINNIRMYKSILSLKYKILSYSQCYSH
jgi:hypothetical protein